MTRSEDITHNMRELIFGIRKDAAKIRTQVRRSKGLEVLSQDEDRHPARPDRHPTRRVGRIHPRGMNTSNAKSQRGPDRHLDVDPAALSRRERRTRAMTADSDVTLDIEAFITDWIAGHQDQWAIATAARQTPWRSTSSTRSFRRPHGPTSSPRCGHWRRCAGGSSGGCIELFGGMPRWGERIGP